MDIIGDRRFVEVPGEKTHELPPLLVKTVPDVKRMDKMMGIASDIIEQEDMVSMADETTGSIELGRWRICVWTWTAGAWTWPLTWSSSIWAC